MRSKKLVRLILLVLILGIATVGCQRIEKPAVGSKGELSLMKVENVDLLPWYHRPISKWRASHMDMISSGKVSAKGCLACHYEPDKFCNKCHQYVGVKKVFEGKNGREVLELSIMEGMEPPANHKPLYKWRTKHDEMIVFGKESIGDCLGCHFEPDKFCNRCHLNIGIRKIPSSIQ